MEKKIKSILVNQLGFVYSGGSQGFTDEIQELETGDFKQKNTIFKKNHVIAVNYED